ncbi:YybH family protein [Pseudomonas sp. XK-1]|uniref:YybH family protein n=1 Tax=Pseudomonas sp. XK-1 TaxID=3136019 RepID=UPI0031192504
MNAAHNPATPHDAQAVLQAAAELVSAFANNDSARYFAAFSEDATFVFHSCDEVLANLDAYRQRWASWQTEGFTVLACTSSAPLLTLHGDSAIFIHDVSTHVRIAGNDLHSRERETIVFRRQPDSDRWLACHEHLSLLAS